MSQGTFNERISTTLHLLDELAARHEETRAYESARERMAYVHDRLGQLQLALGALRVAAALLRAALGDSTGEHTWRSTCAELRARAPATLRSPGQALVAANLDLLRLVEYTGSATALAEERCSQLVALLARYLVTSSESPSPPSMDATKRQIQLAIEQLARSGEPWTSDRLAELRGRLGQEHTSTTNHAGVSA
jgi:hypothetical protein